MYQIPSLHWKLYYQNLSSKERSTARRLFETKIGEQFVKKWTSQKPYRPDRFRHVLWNNLPTFFVICERPLKYFLTFSSLNIRFYLQNIKLNGFIRYICAHNLSIAWHHGTLQRQTLHVTTLLFVWHPLWTSPNVGSMKWTNVKLRLVPFR